MRCRWMRPSKRSMTQLEMLWNSISASSHGKRRATTSITVVSRYGRTGRLLLPTPAPSPSDALLFYITKRRATRGPLRCLTCGWQGVAALLPCGQHLLVRQLRRLAAAAAAAAPPPQPAGPWRRRGPLCIAASIHARADDRPHAESEPRAMPRRAPALVDARLCAGSLFLEHLSTG